MNPTVKKLLPHLIAYLILMAVSFIYFSPAVFEGKVLQQSDNIQALGMQAEMRKVEAQTGEYPLWTNSMFAGMPAYQILYQTGNVLQYVFKAFLLGNTMSPPHTGILLMMAGVYFLLIVLRVDWRIAVAGAVGFGLSTHFMDLVLAGHSTKVIALAYMAPTIAGILLTFRGKYLLGGTLTALFMSLQMYANHVQITYYFLLMAGVLGLVMLGYAIRQKALPRFATAAGVLVLAVGIAFATNTSRLWTTYEYSQETIRGKSELTQKTSSTGSLAGEGGLSKEYAFGWSYGLLETFSLMIPNYMGGTSNESFAADRSSETVKVLQRINSSNPELANQLAQAYSSHYWGEQPFVGGPVYFGAVLVFLFLLGAFLVKRPLKVWLLTATALTIMMAWGKHFSALNYFLFDYFPLYSKFRAVTMALDVTNFFVVILGMLGLQAFLGADKTIGEKRKALYYAGGTFAGLLLISIVLAHSAGFGTDDPTIPGDLANALAADRAGLLYSDALRSFLFAGAAFALLWLSLRKGVSARNMAIGVGLIILLDLWIVDRRFVSTDDFIRPSDKAQITSPTPTDEQIMQDPALHYRVADFRRNPWTNALTSYHHKSMGGYHAAKLMRYQEMIERYLGDPNKSMHIYGMLNAKYFIGPSDQAQINPMALGNAWFVRQIQQVPDGDAEIAALADFDPATTAIVQEQYADYLQGLPEQVDTTASIELVHYHPDTMIYRYSTAVEQLAVFSEVYYPPSKGWSLYLDGEKMDPFIKVDFLLRAARLPAGQNRELKMIFEPRSYYTGETITTATSWLVLLAAVGGVFLFFRQGGTAPEPDQLPVTPEKEATGAKASGTARKRKKK